MNCIFKKPDGKLCVFPALNDSEYCFLHNKNLISLLFKEDCPHYKKDQFVFGLPKEEGEKYFYSGAAIKIDRKLYKRFLMKQTITDAKNSDKSFNKGSALIKDI